MQIRPGRFDSGPRLREAYRLRAEDLNFELRTIHVRDSKTGRARDVPMTKEAFAWLKEAPAEGLVFPFWTGEASDLKRTTNRLSQQFVRIFKLCRVRGPDRARPQARGGLQVDAHAG